MKISDIDRFFLQLDGKIDVPITALITGGAAAILFGGTRATQDIDFEVTFKLTPKKAADAWPKLQQSLDDVVRTAGIAAQYSDDIDRWSSIKIPSKKSALYKRIGKIEIRILDPGLWAIGKLSRYVGSDTQDLVDVLSKFRPKPAPLVKLWAKALRMSPPSPSQTGFRRHVDYFLDSYAQKIWGKKTDPSALKKLFLRTATTRAS